MRARLAGRKHETGAMLRARRPLPQFCMRERAGTTPRLACTAPADAAAASPLRRHAGSNPPGRSSRLLDRSGERGCLPPYPGGRASERAGRLRALHATRSAAATGAADKNAQATSRVESVGDFTSARLAQPWYGAAGDY